MKTLIKGVLLSSLVCLVVSCGSEEESEEESKEESSVGGSSGGAKKSRKFEMTEVPPITLVNRNAYEIKGTCTAKGKNISIVVETLEPTQAPCGQDYKWQVRIDVSGLDRESDVISITATELGKSQKVEVKQDVIAPVLTIDSGQAIVTTLNQGSYRLTGTCDEADGEVILNVGGIEGQGACDGQNWESEGIDLSGLDPTLSQVDVTADLKDKVGNPAPRASSVLTRDVTPPDSITLTTTLAAINIATIDSASSYSLEGNCSEDGTDVVTIKITGLNNKTVDCSEGGWSASLSSTELAELPNQQGIALSVEHRDSVGNVRSFLGSLNKDTQAPALTITSGLVINIKNQNGYELEGGCSENGRSVTITLEGNDPITEDCVANVWKFTPSLSSEGSFTVTLKQTDEAGNTTNLTHPDPLIRDVVAPTFSFDADLDINIANEEQYYVSGTCSEVGTVTVSVADISGSLTAECDGSIWVTNAFDTSSINSPASVVLSAEMVDAAGNPAAEEAITKTVNKDTTSRAVAIDRLPNAPNAPPINLANAESYPVKGTCSSSHTGDVTVTVGGTASATGTCNSNGRWTVNVNIPSTIDDGPDVIISATFGSGTDQASDTARALKDTVRPTLDTTPSPITGSNQESYSLSGSCTDGQGVVSLNIGGISASANCESDAWERNDLNVSTLEGESITITADVSDAVGNPAIQLSKTVVRDVIPPTLTITGPEDISGTTNQDSYSISGTCEENGTGNVQVTIAGGTPQTVDCTSNAWTISPVVANIPEGLNHALAVEHWDVHNNRTVISETISKDTVAPQIVVTSDPLVNKEEVDTGHTLTGTCEGSKQLSIKVGSQDAANVDCTGGNWQYDADLLAYATSDQNIVVAIAQWDDFQNEGRLTHTLEIDVTPPTLTVTTPPTDMNGDDPSFSILGTCSGLRRSPTEQTVTITIDGSVPLPHIPGMVCRSSEEGEWEWGFQNTTIVTDFILANVSDNTNIPITLRMPDAWGNIAETTTIFNKDTTPPVVAINTPLASITEGNLNAYPVSGTCTPGDGVVTVKVRAASADTEPDCSSGGTWTASVDVTDLIQGVLAVTASQTDPFGNTGFAPEQSIIKTIAVVDTAIAEAAAAACSNAAAEASGFNDGDGSSADPYVICTYTQLGKIRDDLDAHYQLGKDIDATDSWSAGNERDAGADTDNTDCTPFDDSNGDNGDICTGWVPIGSAGNCNPDDSVDDVCFQGTLNGNGFAIDKLYLNISGGSGHHYGGLFGVTGENARIFRLPLTNVAIFARSTSGTLNIGAIAAENEGRIQTSYATGSITTRITSGVSYSGGLIGLNTGTIDNTYGTVSVIFFNGNNSGTSYLGGLVGKLTGEIGNSYSRTNLEALSGGGSLGYSYRGGLAGESEGGTIRNAHSAVKDIGLAGGYSAHDRGGIVGKSDGATSFVGVLYYASKTNPVGEGTQCSDNVCKAATGSTSGDIDDQIEAVRKLSEDDALGWSDGIWSDLLDDRFACLIGVTPGCQRPENQICSVQTQKEIWARDVTIADSLGPSGNSLGSEGDHSFDYGGVTYTVDTLYWDSSATDPLLTLTFTADVTSAASNDWGALEFGSATSLLFIDADVISSGKTYTWPLANPGWSASDMVSFTITENTLPTSLMATATGATQIDLSWTAPEDDNGSPPVAGYHIEFSQDSGSTWQLLVGHTESPTAAYSHTGLSSATEYCYRVWAMHPACRARRPSAQTCVTTPHP